MSWRICGSHYENGRSIYRRPQLLKKSVGCALPLFPHPHQRDTARGPIGTGRLCARRRFGYWGEQIGQCARSRWSPFQSPPAELEPATAGWFKDGYAKARCRAAADRSGIALANPWRRAAPQLLDTDVMVLYAPATSRVGNLLRLKVALRRWPEFLRPALLCPTRWSIHSAS